MIALIFAMTECSHIPEPKMATVAGVVIKSFHTKQEIHPAQTTLLAVSSSIAQTVRQIVLEFWMAQKNVGDLPLSHIMLPCH